MKTSVIKADEKAANQLFADFQKENTKLTDGTTFIKKSVTRNKETGEEYIDGSFIIRRVKLESPEKGVTIFRFLKTEINNRIEWDERYCTI